MTKYICDRCGGEMKNKPESVEVPSSVVSHSPMFYDLCSSCLASLNRWLATLPQVAPTPKDK